VRSWNAFLPTKWSRAASSTSSSGKVGPPESVHPRRSPTRRPLGYPDSANTWEPPTSFVDKVPPARRPRSHAHLAVRWSQSVLSDYETELAKEAKEKEKAAARGSAKKSPAAKRDKGEAATPGTGKRGRNAAAEAPRSSRRPAESAGTPPDGALILAANGVTRAGLAGAAGKANAESEDHGERDRAHRSEALTPLIVCWRRVSRPTRVAGLRGSRLLGSTSAHARSLTRRARTGG
jgi:hypothetical protein